MTLSRHTTALLALAAACIGLAGCGDEDTGDPIPGDKVAAMEQKLDAVQQAADESRCEDVGPAVSELQTQIATLDENGVGDDVQDALGDGADNLRSIASDSCEPEEPETTPETTVTPPPTETTPPPPPEEPEEPIEPPADEDDGGGQFDPSGGGAVPPGQAKKGDDD